MDSRSLDRTVSDVISPADIGKYLSRTGQALQRGTGTACTIVEGPFLHGMWSTVFQYDLPVLIYPESVFLPVHVRENVAGDATGDRRPWNPTWA